jgi:hypothetical protein
MRLCCAEKNNTIPNECWKRIGVSARGPSSELNLSVLQPLYPNKSSNCVTFLQVTGYPKLGEADPGGLGACPQEEKQLKQNSVNWFEIWRQLCD